MSSTIISFFPANVCRLCTNTDDNVVPIFDKTNKKECMYNKLKKCLPSLQILENDLKPKQICKTCVTKLDLLISFQDMSQDSDSKLDTLLQNKIMSQILVLNDSLLNDKSFCNNEEVQGVTFKERQEWKDMKTSPLKMENSSNPKTTQQCMNVAVSTSNSINITPDLGALTNGSILQNLLTQNANPVQDIVVLLELKYKDNTNDSVMLSKKSNLPQELLVPKQEIQVSNPQQTKIMDTNGNIRVINLSDFDGKFNHFDKIASSFINDANEKLTNNSDILNTLYMDSTIVSTEVPKYDSNSTVSSASNSTDSMIISLFGKSQSGNDFRCGLCGKQFTRRNRLNAHIARHSSERPHQCDKCDQRFITKWDLTLHLRIHSGIFSCEFCGKAFPAKGKLERHRRVHTGERPFPCTICDRAFSERRNLKNHLKTHSTYENDEHCGRRINNTQTSQDSCKSCNKNVDNSAECGVAVKEEASQEIAWDGPVTNLSDLVNEEVSDFLKT